MAKGKHAAALFEVIHSSRAMKMPPPIRRRRSGWLGQMLRSTGSQVAAAGSALRGTAGAIVLRDRPAAPPKASRSPVDMSMDSDRQLISFKLTYHSAIVSGFAVLVVIGLAYVVGKKMSRGPAAATASASTAELRAHEAHPNVLNVGDKNSTIPPTLSAVTPNNDADPDGKAKAAASSAANSASPERIIGRQYVIVQTFSEESTARAAKAFLEKNKLPCTIENGLPGWAPKNKFCLVGNTGFDHIRGNPDFDKYEAQITKVGAAFAEANKARPFEPRAYRWK